MNIIREDNIFYIGNPKEKDAYITFVVNNGVVTIEHTVVSDKLKGQGIGAKLVHEVAEYVREKGLKVNSTCWYADGILNKKEEYHDILTK